MNFYCISGSHPCNTGVQCIEHNHKTYFIYEVKPSTWFEAKQYCSKQNQTLASFSGADLSPVKGLIAGKVTGWADAWIGLRLTDYYIQANNSRSL